MKKILLLILLSVFTNCFSQNYLIYKGDTINRTINDTIKIGRWITFENDKPIEEVGYFHNKKNGVCTQYYPDGSVKMRLPYIYNKAEGVAILYYEKTGKIKETGIWKNKRWMGTYNLYFPNGALQQVFTFNTNGKREGLQKYYYENGIIQAIYIYEDGKQEGFVSYDIKGNRTGFNYGGAFIKKADGKYDYYDSFTNKENYNHNGIYDNKMHDKDVKAVEDAEMENKNMFVSFIDKLVQLENSTIFQRENLLRTQIENQKQKLEGFEKLRQIDLLTQSKSIQEATIKAKQLELEKEKILKDKKSNEIVLLSKEKEQQKIVILFVALGLLLVLVFAGFVFRSLRIRNKQNRIIVDQKRVVEKQKHLVEEKNREITDSIEYALRIQTAILPPHKVVKQYLENSFVLYKPKDIVAGDFYWMETIGDLVLFSACDCTGHGVPGAMVSVVCHNALNRAVREFGLTQPSLILDKTAEIVIENFSKSEENIKDGMDISLCAYNTKTKTLQWAGANNPLWLMQNGELIETKADKQPIGMYDDNHPFTNHQFQLNSGDSIYIFSDGFADQFGGDTGAKKLTRKRFKELLFTIQGKSMQEQGIALDKFIIEYRKDVEQIDDILVMGVKV